MLQWLKKWLLNMGLLIERLDKKMFKYFWYKLFKSPLDYLYLKYVLIMSVMIAILILTNK